MELRYIPMYGKAPAEKDWQKKLYTREQLANWEVIGLPTGEPNRIVVRDYDDLAIAREEHLVRRDLFKVLVRTPNGLHVYLRQPEFPVPNAVKVGGKPIDLRGAGGLVVAEGSIINGKRYEYVPNHELRSVDELPVFPADWLPPPETINLTRQKVQKVTSYLGKVDSLQGKNGSAGLVRAAAICRDAGLTESEAMVELLKWNNGPTVSPPWSAEQLARACSRIYAKGKPCTA